MVHKDFRWRRLLEDLVFPSPKEDMGPRTLAFIKMVLASKRNSVLFATFPKCGWNWTGDILEYCITKKYTGEFNVEFREEGTLKERMKKPVKVFTPADSRSRNRKKVSEMFSEIDLDYCFHTHGHRGYSPLWGLDEAKHVFITRDIPTSLFSYFKSKIKLKEHETFESFIEGGSLDRAILYYNTWGDFCKRSDTTYKIFKYEEMRKDPKTSFSQMYEFVFKVPIEPEILEEALDYFSFEKQKEREFMFEKDETKHFHFQGKTDYKDQMKPETLKMIQQRLTKELKHNFGYDYNKN